MIQLSDVQARQIPRASSADKRVKTVVYDPHNVVAIRGYYGFATMIEFGPDEEVVLASAGDTVAWQVVADRNRVLIKPMENNAQTNLQVVTSKRTYAFELTSGKSKSARSRYLTYILRFIYPDEEAAKFREGQAKHDRFEKVTVGKKGKPVQSWNLDYSVSGSRSIAPLHVLDDGEFTYFEFEKIQDIPAIFVVGQRGEESLVNYRVEGQYIVVERLGKQFSLREGEDLTCIFNEAWPEGKDGTIKTKRPVGKRQAS